jgi:hypothetical protein
MLLDGAPPSLQLDLRALPPGADEAAPGAKPAGAELPAGGLRQLEDLFKQARESVAPRSRGKDGKAAGERRPGEPPADGPMELLAGVLSGAVRAQVRCSTQGGVPGALAVAAACGFKAACLYDAPGAFRSSEALRSGGIAVATPAAWWDLPDGGAGEAPDGPSLLFRHGVNVAIAPQSSDRIQHMGLEAARQIRWGDLTRDEALALVTIGPARILGLDSRLGSIEAGKDADLVLFDRDPTSVYARVEATLVDGVVVYDQDQDYDAFVVAPAAVPPRPAPAAAGPAPVPARGGSR